MWRIEIDALPPSLNKFYSGMHWAVMKRARDEWHGLMQAAFIEAKLPKTIPTPISLNITQFCKGHLRDSDNAVIAAKFCGDALRIYGYIPDDTPQYIDTIILRSEKGKTNKTVILIQEV